MKLIKEHYELNKHLSRKAFFKEAPNMSVFFSPYMNYTYLTMKISYMPI